MTDWPTFSVLELQSAGVLLVEDGNHGEYRPRPHEFTDTGWAFIRAADIDAGQVLFDSAQRISEVARNRIRKGIGQGGDVLFSHKGTVGKLALVHLDAPSFVCSPQTTFWRSLDENRLDRRFLHCFMQSVSFIKQWRARKGETDMADYVSLTAQRTFQVAIPPLAEQRAIASVLGSLDDKIELNRRMNRTLEGMASSIFKAWFVDFEPVRAKAAGAAAFPGMPQPVFDALPATFADSELGPIPEGWEVGCIGDIGKNRRDGVQPSEIDAETPYIGLEHMPKRCIALDAWDGAGKVTSGKSEFRRGDILFGKLRPYFHKVGVAPIDGVCSTDVVVVRPKADCWSALLLGHLSSLDFVNYTDSCSTGTKMPRTNWKDMARYPIAVPPEFIAAEATRLILPMVETILANIHESRTLAETRDVLLPKLLSGEVRVESISESAPALEAAT